MERDWAWMGAKMKVRFIESWNLLLGKDCCFNRLWKPIGYIYIYWTLLPDTFPFASCLFPHKVGHLPPSDKLVYSPHELNQVRYRTGAPPCAESTGSLTSPPRWRAPGALGAPAGLRTQSSAALRARCGAAQGPPQGAAEICSGRVFPWENPYL